LTQAGRNGYYCGDAAVRHTDAERGPELVGAIRQAVRKCGLSLNELSRRSGVSQPQLSRFMREERSLTLDSASKLIDCLPLRVIIEEIETPASAEAEKPAKRRQPKKGQ
jgi:transcriptional regulator with XRE-family HTH domain